MAHLYIYKTYVATYFMHDNSRQLISIVQKNKKYNILPKDITFTTTAPQYLTNSTFAELISNPAQFLGKEAGFHNPPTRLKGWEPSE